MYIETLETPPGIVNLHGYIQYCRLPSLGYDPLDTFVLPSGHKNAKNGLAVRQERWRRLENIHPVPEDLLMSLRSSWIASNIPSAPLNVHEPDRLTGERLTIIIPLSDTFPWHLEKSPTDIIRLAQWIDSLPLATVKRIMHLCIPETRGWTFNNPQHRSEADSEIFHYYLWSPRRPTNLAAQDPTRDADGAAVKSLLIAVQPPWILSECDMKEFAACKSFPPFMMPGHAYSTPLVNKYKIWAKLWDACVREKTHWFVVTSYNQWVFGAFSRGWSAAFVTGVMNFDAVGPSVVESLAFWIASAMYLPGAFQCPKVPEPVQHTPAVSAITAADLSPPVESEAGWEGKSIEPASSAGVSDCIDGISDDGLPDYWRPQDGIARDKGVPVHVHEWLHDRAQNVDQVLKPDPPNLFIPLVYQRLPPAPGLFGDWLM